MPTLDYVAPDPGLGHNCRERDLERRGPIAAALAELRDREFLRRFDRILDDAEAYGERTDFDHRGWHVEVRPKGNGMWRARIEGPDGEEDSVNASTLDAVLGMALDEVDRRTDDAKGRDTIAVTAATVRREPAGVPVTLVSGEPFRECDEPDPFDGRDANDTTPARLDV